MLYLVAFDEFFNGAKRIGKIIPKNSVIMSCVGEFGLVGITEHEVVLNQQLHAFQCLDKIIPYFLLIFLL